MTGAAQGRGEGDPRPGPAPGSRFALGLAVAALAACWNPISAPFGLVVGAGALVLAARAWWRATSARGVATAAVAAALLAVAASAAVLGLTAEAVSPDLPGQAVVKTRTPEELDRLLSDASKRTQPERRQAARQLEILAGSGDGGASPGEGRRGAKP